MLFLSAGRNLRTISNGPTIREVQSPARKFRKAEIVGQFWDRQTAGKVGIVEQFDPGQTAERFRIVDPAQTVQAIRTIRIVGQLKQYGQVETGLTVQQLKQPKGSEQLKFLDNSKAQKSWPL